MPLFYSKDFSTTNPELDEKECHHAINVLRITNEELIQITDGKGHLYHGYLTPISKKKYVVKITKQEPWVANAAQGFHLAVCPTKSMDRNEWIVEKCTEIGIEGIHFLKAKHSERKEINILKLEAIAAGAMKQSQRLYIPLLSELQSLQDFLKKQTFSKLYIADQFHSLTLSEWTVDLKKHKNVCILIGPEGGFSKEEIELVNTYNAHTVSLGDHRLRTETAAVVASYQMQLSRLC
jgi:16S rRNA (uracil1498-N3)-methyltransferase